jgi:hypothetical protein
VIEEDGARVLKSYPRLFFACHDQHVTDPAAPKVLSANQVSILDHLDKVEPTGLADLDGTWAASGVAAQANWAARTTVAVGAESWKGEEPACLPRRSAQAVGQWRHARRTKRWRPGGIRHTCVAQSIRRAGEQI